MCFLSVFSSLLQLYRLVTCADGEQEDETSFDLFEISHISRRTLGAKQFRGQNLDLPAYRFIRFDHLPPVSAPILTQILRQMQNNEGFVFVANVRQDRASRGTLLGFEGPNGQRQFEIVSNGRTNTLDLVYWVDGNQNSVQFEDVDVSDSQWKNITLHVHGENANLFVGCHLVDSFILDEPFYEHLQAEGGRMYVAKGSSRESHFRVRPKETFHFARRQGRGFPGISTDFSPPLALEKLNATAIFYYPSEAKWGRKKNAT